MALRERKTKSVLPGQSARTARFSGFIFGSPAVLLAESVIC